jgi:hypothetical protein
MRASEFSAVKTHLRGVRRTSSAALVQPGRSENGAYFAGLIAGWRSPGLILAMLLLAAVSPLRAAFELAGPRGAATVILAPGEAECVRLAAADLAGDVRKITGRTLGFAEPAATPAGPAVVLVSLNRPESAAWLEKIAPGFGADLGGKWEAYRVEAVGDRLIVAGSDERGTMFGLYAFIEKYLEVDPLHFWASRPPRPRASLAWDEVKLVSGEPSFKFRGWFINDEDLLTEWKGSGGKRDIDYPYYGQVVPREVMGHIAEALVRSRFNLIIPASFIDILNPPEAALVEECARRGVFLSQHHVEPMGVSAFSYFNYWKKRGRDLKYSYFSHPAEVREVWRAYAAEWAKHPNVIWQLGLRGIADRPMWMADPATPQSDADRGRLISEAMAAQVKILDEVAPAKPRHLSTTLWAEGSVLNQKNLLTIPAETMVVFADNSPGWKWQEDFYATPRRPENRYGVYYHHALIGSGPHLAQVPSPRQTFECMQAAVKHGASSYAIFNVSNIREFVLGIDATAKMTWRMADFDPERFLDEWVAARFSKKSAEIANAYRIYFNAWQIHDLQQVPFLMDGQMFSAGNRSLGAMASKLRERKTGAGTVPESLRPRGRAPVRDMETARETADSFWASLNDMHPESTRRERIRRVAAQQAGLELVLLHARAAAAALPADEARLLNDNLVFQSAIMVQTSAWLAHVERAHEALDLGQMPECIAALTNAEAAFARIPELAKSYASGEWEGWYRGSKKLNIAAILQRTRDLLEQAKKIP